MIEQTSMAHRSSCGSARTFSRRSSSMIFGKDRCRLLDFQTRVEPLLRFLICSNTNSRIAEDRFFCWRVLSIIVTIFDNVTPCLSAISFKLRQKVSSRLTLVLRPLMTSERLTAEDFMVGGNRIPKFRLFVASGTLCT
jgi:hypothetical protein